MPEIKMITGMADACYIRDPFFQYSFLVRLSGN